MIDLAVKFATDFSTSAFTLVQASKPNRFLRKFRRAFEWLTFAKQHQKRKRSGARLQTIEAFSCLQPRASRIEARSWIDFDRVYLKSTVSSQSFVWNSFSLKINSVKSSLGVYFGTSSHLRPNEEFFFASYRLRKWRCCNFMLLWQKQLETEYSPAFTTIPRIDSPNSRYIPFVWKLSARKILRIKFP